jgi:hypothetical protein
MDSLIEKEWNGQNIEKERIDHLTIFTLISKHSKASICGVNGACNHKSKELGFRILVAEEEELVTKK